MARPASAGVPAGLAVPALLLLAGCSNGIVVEPTLELHGPTLRLREKGGVLKALPKKKKDVELDEIVGDPDRHPLAAPANARRDAEQWTEDSFAVELGADQLFRVRRYLEGRLTRAELAEAFASDAVLGLPAPPLADPEPLALDVVERAWDLESARSLDLDAWADAVDAWRATLGRVRWVRILPESVELDGGLAQVEVEWVVNVELPDGGLRHDRGTFRSEWVAGDDSRPESSVGWRCRELVPVKGFALSSDAPSWVDVTGEALAGTAVDPRLPFEANVFNRAIALADLEGDGDLDIAVSRPNRVLLNDGEGNFRDLDPSRGVTPDNNYHGVVVADFDRDGDLDIVYAGKRTRSLLYEQRGKLKFRRRELWVTGQNNIPTSVAAHDVDEDGWLDLFICGYGAFLGPGPESPLSAENARFNQMLKGSPEGFVDVTEDWGLRNESSRWSFIGTFGDADGDGDDDLYVANDFGKNVLYRRVQHLPPRFEPEVEDPDEIAPGFSMSASWADLDGDLDLDLYVSNIESLDAQRQMRMTGHGADGDDAWLRDRMSSGNTLLRQQDGRLVESDDPIESRDAGWAWGTVIFDWDLDRDLDIGVSNGFMTEGIDDARDWDSVWWRRVIIDLHRDPDSWLPSYEEFDESKRHGWSWSAFQPSRFFLNDGTGRFTDLAPALGFDQTNVAFALAMGDLDLDGDHDVVGTGSSSPPVFVLRNDTRTDGHFLWVELVPAGNRSAVGAELRLTASGVTQRRDIVIGEGFLTQHELARHFGLGDATTVERLEVTWPGGERTVLTDLPVDRRLRLEQGVEGWTEVELRPLNDNATNRLGEVEWVMDLARIDPVADDRLDRAVATAMVPSPLDAPVELGELQAVVLWDPSARGTRERLAGLEELARLEGLQVHLVTPSGTEPPLADGVAHASYVEGGFERTLRALDHTCGTIGLPWPVVLYVREGRVDFLSRDAIVPDRVRALLARRE